MKEFIWVLHERNDKYEFPVLVTDTIEEVASKLGISTKGVIKRLKDNNQRQCKYIVSQVEID